MCDLSGRTALVTGGGRGIGAGISLALAKAGADVVINYARHAEPAEEIAEKIRGLRRKAYVCQGDVSDFDSCKAMVERALVEAGPISILVNNAGIASRGQSIADTDPAEMRRVVATHGFGPWNMSHLLVPQMRALPRGDVIMITSAATKGLGANGAPYNMGKNAAEAVAYTLAKEERQHGIRVNIVAPGLVDTEMGFRLVRATRGVQDIRELDASAPFGKVCQPEDIADVVVFLCSDAARYVTHQRIYVDGGF